MAATTIGEAIYNRAIAHAGLSALIGKRVYPKQTPEGGVLPAVVYRRISAVREHASGSDPGLVTARYQFTGLAQTYSGSEALAAQVRSAFSRWSATDGTVVIQGVFLDNETDSEDYPTGKALDVEMSLQDFTFFYLE
jgi:hypothetical protein